MISELQIPGVIADLREYGERRLPCPQCDKGPKDTALAVKVDALGAVWICHRCGWRGAAKWGDGTVTSTAQPTWAMPQPKGFTDYAAAVWSRTQPITPDCIVGRYLAGRKCALPPDGSDQRWVSELKHAPSGRVLPAMVGLITDALDASARLGLHRTYLAPDGCGKADVTPAKMYLCSPLHDGVVRIWPDNAVTTGLGIAEGIESALSLALAFTPVWCCMDAGHLKDFPVLAGIEALMIGADNDGAGLSAAEVCAQRWANAGLEVNIIRSTFAGHDLNDEAQ